MPSAADGKGLCRPPFEPLPSAMADGKVAVSRSGRHTSKRKASDSVRKATDNLRRRLSPEARFRPIQDELAGFFMREVINPKGEHYTEDEEIYMHTRD